MCYHPRFSLTTDAERQKALLVLIEFFVVGLSFHFVMIDFIFNVLFTGFYSFKISSHCCIICSQILQMEWLLV